MEAESIKTLDGGTLLRGGTYRIIRFLSKGGFGCTYLAEHTLLNKRVAIKELYIGRYCARDASGAVYVCVPEGMPVIEKLHRKFLDEARAQSRMSHGGVVRVTDVFEENGTAYYVMDFIDGESLSDRVKRLGHGMTEHEALGYIRQVADALAYVHSTGRLHLDIKPANIMVDRNDRAILIDFGVSKQYDRVSGENDSTLIGQTPGYSSPEQHSNNMRYFTPASDIYSLGATLYYLLTGSVIPDTDLRYSGEPVEPLAANISPSTRQAVDAALRLRKDERPQSVAAFLKMLDGDRTMPPPPAAQRAPRRRTSLWVVLILLALAATAAAIYLMRRPASATLSRTVVTPDTSADVIGHDTMHLENDPGSKIDSAGEPIVGNTDVSDQGVGQSTSTDSPSHHPGAVGNSAGHKNLSRFSAMAGSFSEGLQPVKLRSTGKYGYIDKSYNLVIAARYDFADEFRGGRAAVKLGGEFFYIDRHGHRLRAE